MKSRRTRDSSRLKLELLVHSAEISSSLARSVLLRFRYQKGGGQGSFMLHACRNNASKRPLGRYDFAGEKRRPGTFTVCPGRFLKK